MKERVTAMDESRNATVRDVANNQIILRQIERTT